MNRISETPAIFAPCVRSLAARPLSRFLPGALLGGLPRYIAWIDIGQVVNERFLHLFAECLRSADEQLVQRSCSCILEVVNKVNTLLVAVCVRFDTTSFLALRREGSADSFRPKKALGVRGNAAL